MKCAIVADTVLISRDNNYYSMTLTYDFLSERYSQYYDKIFLISRVEDEKKSKGDISGYKITNGNNIYATPIKEYRKVSDAIKNKKIIEKKIYEQISKCDIVIIRLPNVLGLIASSICEKYGIKYYVEMLACPLDGYWNHKNNFGKILAPIMYILNKKAIKKAPYVLYVTNEFLQKRYPTNGKSISCSDVALESIPKSIIENRKRKIKKINKKSEIKLCTIGNVGLKYKGHEYVIKAMKKCNNKNIKYYLIGNGDKSRLLKIIRKYGQENNVIFIGSVPHNKIFKLLNDMDIYIQPSLQEGMPRALLEAMSVGIPCYGSNAGGIPEILNTKFIFKKRAVNEISNYLNSITMELLIENMNSVLDKIKEYDVEILKMKRDKFYSGRL